VRWTALWPGIDVVAREQDRHLEYDLELVPGADLDRVEIAVKGSERLAINADGALVIETAAGPLRQEPPRSWVVDARGSRTSVEVRYVLRGADRFGLRCPDWDGASALVVDPGLVWSTYLGGNNRDEISGADVGPSGVITVCGTTWSTDFPTTTGAYQATFNGGGTDAFVARLDPSLPANQQLVAATFIGGLDDDWAKIDILFLMLATVREVDQYHR
jgi:hypothetical protein